jgi:hypothetical protein
VARIPDSAELAAYREREIHSYLKAVEVGVDCWLMILPCDDCEASKVVEGARFDEVSLPTIPLPGCVRKPCCACAILTGVPPAKTYSPEESAQIDRDYEAELAKLPKGQADAIRRSLSATLSGFGIEPLSPKPPLRRGGGD